MKGSACFSRSNLHTNLRSVSGCCCRRSQLVASDPRAHQHGCIRRPRSCSYLHSRLVIGSWRFLLFQERFLFPSFLPIKKSDMTNLTRARRHGDGQSKGQPSKHCFFRNQAITDHSGHNATTTGQRSIGRRHRSSCSPELLQTQSERRAGERNWNPPMSSLSACCPGHGGALRSSAKRQSAHDQSEMQELLNKSLEVRKPTYGMASCWLLCPKTETPYGTLCDSSPQRTLKRLAGRPRAAR